MKKHFDLLRRHGHVTTVATTAHVTPTLFTLFKTGMYKDWLRRSCQMALLLVLFLGVSSVAFGQTVTSSPVTATICSDGSVNLTAAVTGGSNPVRWKVIGNNGTFSDSLSTTTSYTPNPVVGAISREDEIVVSIEKRFPIEWEAIENNVDAIDGMDPSPKASVTATATTGGQNGAFSKNVLGLNQDGWVETTITDLNKSVVVFGLSSLPESAYDKVDFGISLQLSNGSRIILVSEDGQYPGLGNDYTPPNWGLGSVVRVERREGFIYYSIDGTVFYTSEQTSTSELKIDVGLVYEGEGIENLEASFDDGSNTDLTAMVMVTVRASAFVELGNDTFACDGIAVELEPVLGFNTTINNFRIISGPGSIPNSSPYEYTSSGTIPDPSRTDVIEVTGTAPSCPNYKDTIQIVINELDDIAMVSGADPTPEVCELDSVQLEYELDGASLGEYVEWRVATPGVGSFYFPNPVDSSDVQYIPAIRNDVSVPRVDTVYATLRESSPCGITEIKFDVTVNKAPLITKLSGDKTDVCGNEDVVVTIEFGGSATDYNTTSIFGNFDKPNSTFTPTGVPFLPLSTTATASLIVETVNPTVNCSTVLDTLDIIVHQQQTVSLGGLSQANTFRCDRDSLFLSVTTIGNIPNINWTEINGNGIFNATANPNNYYYLPNDLSQNAQRIDTLVVAATNSSICDRSADTVFLLVQPTPTIAVSGPDFVVEGETIDLVVTLDGSATGFTSMVKPSESVAISDLSTFDDNTEILTGGKPAGFSRIDTLIVESTGQNAACGSAIFKFPITVYRATSIEITNPAGNIDRCANDTIDLTASLNAPNSTVVWEVLNGNGTFEDSLMTSTEYYPNPLPTNMLRQDVLIATLIESRPVTWIDTNGATIGGTTAISNLTKVAGTDNNWGTGGARSQHTLADGTDGYVQVVATAAMDDVAFGLSTNNLNDDYISINYGIILLGDAATKQAYVVENGTPIPNTTMTFVATDSFRVERVGNQIVYKLNETVLHTRPAPNAELLIDVALKNIGDILPNVSTSILPADREVRKDTVIVNINNTPTIDFGLSQDYTVCAGDSILVNYTIDPSAVLLAMVKADSGAFNLESNYYTPKTPVHTLTRQDTLIAFTNSIGTCSNFDTLIINVTQADTISTDLTGAPNKMISICERDTSDAYNSGTPVMGTIKMNLGKAAVGKDVTWQLHGAANGLIVYPTADSTEIRYTPNFDASVDTLDMRVDTLIATVNPVGGCGTVSDSIFVEVLKIPTITVANPMGLTEICYGDSIQIDTTLGGSSYAFDLMIENGDISNAVDGDYNRATGFYLPSTMPALDSVRLDTLIFNGISSTGNSCTAIPDTFIVKVFEQPSVTITNPPRLGPNFPVRVVNRCDEDPLYVVAAIGGSATSLTWSTLNNTGDFDDANALATFYNPNPLGNLVERYDTILVTTDANGPCVAAVDTVVLRMWQRPTIDLVTDGTVCEGDSTQILFTIGNSGDTLETNYPMLVTDGLTTADFDYNEATMYYTPLGTITGIRVDTLVFQTKAHGTCLAVRDSVVIEVTELDEIVTVVTPDPVDVDANKNSIVCEEGTIRVAMTPSKGAVNNNKSLTWSTTGLGTFNYPTTDTTKIEYTPAIDVAFDGTITRIDTLIAKVVPENACGDAQDTVFVNVTKTPAISISSSGFVYEGDSIEIISLLGGGAISYDIANSNSDIVAAATVTMDYNKESSFYTPNGTPTNFSRTDTLIGTVPATGSCDPISDTILITVFRASSIIIDQGPNDEVCAIDTFDLTVTVDPATATEVNWTTLDNSGTFEDSTGIITDYYPNPMANISENFRIDRVVATLVELRPVEWMGLNNITVGGSGLDLTRDAGSGPGWNGAGGRSTAELESGEDGFVEFEVSTDHDIAIGLSSGSNTSDDHFNTINYGLRQDAMDKTVFVIENGNELASTAMLYTPGDIFRIERIGNVVYYKDQTGTFYTSTISSNSVLYIDAAIKSTSGVINNVMTSILPEGAFAKKDTIDLLVKFTPILDLGIDTVNVCHGDSLLIDLTINPNTTDLITATSTDGTYNFDSGYYIPDNNFGANERIDMLIGRTDLLGQCQSELDTLIIRVTPRDSVYTTPPIFVCDNDTVPINAIPSSVETAILWTIHDGDGTIISANSQAAMYVPNPILTNVAIRRDTLYVTTVPSAGSGCEPVRDTLVINVRPRATIIASQDITICETDDAILSAMLGNHTTFGGWDLITLNSRAAAPTTPNSNPYTYDPVAVTDGDVFRVDTLIVSATSIFGVCGMIEDTVIVRVQEDPTITIMSPTTMIGSIYQEIVCEEGTVNLEATMTGATNVTWELIANHAGNGVISNANSSTATYVPNPVTGTVNTRKDTLIIHTTDLGGCKPDTQYVEVLVRKPTTLSMVSDTVVCEGTSVDLTTTLTGNGSFTAWRLTNPNTPFTDFPLGMMHQTTYSPVGLIGGVPRVDTIEYSATSLFGVCGIFRDTALVTVFPNAVVSIMDVAGQVPTDIDTMTICEGDTIEIVGMVNAGVNGVQWRSNAGTFMADSDTTTMYIPNPGQTTNNRYDTVIIASANPTGCAPVEDSIIIKVRRAANLSAIADTTFCSSGTIDLSATATVTDNSMPNPNMINWELIPGGTAGGSITATTASGVPNTYDPVNAGMVQIRYFSDNPPGLCPVEEDTILVTIIEESLVSVGNRDTITVCEGNSIDLEGTVGGGSTGIIWNSVSNNGTFVDETMAITQYTPNTGQLINTRIDTLTITTTDAAAGCDFVTDTLIVRVRRATNSTVVPDAMVCSDETIDFNAESTGFGNDIIWKVVSGGTLANAAGDGTVTTSNITETVTYMPSLASVSRVDTITYSTVDPPGICPSHVDTILVTILPESMVSVGAQDTIVVCEGDAIDLLGTVDGGSTDVIWNVVSNQGNILNASSLSAQYKPFTGQTTNTRYDTLTITTTNSATGCQTTMDTLIVKVRRAAALSIAAEDTTCLFMPVAMSAQSIGFGDDVIWTVAHGTGNFDGMTTVTTNGTLTANYTPTGTITGGFRIDTLEYATVDPAGICPAVSHKVAVRIEDVAIAEVDDPTKANDTLYVCEGLSVDLDGSYNANANGATWTIVNSNNGNLVIGASDTLATYTPINTLTSPFRYDTIVLTPTPIQNTCNAVPDTLIVVVEQAPIIVPGMDSVRVCIDGITTLSATASGNGTGIVWSVKDPANGTINATTGEYSPIGTVTGIEREDIIYITSNTTQSCLATVDSISVFAVAKPSLVLGPDQSLCVNTGNIIVPQSLGAGNQLTLYGNSGIVNADNGYIPNNPFPAVNRQDVIYGIAVDSFGVCTSSAVLDQMVVRITEPVEIIPVDNDPICEADTMVLDPSYAGLPEYFTAEISEPNGQVILFNDQVLFIPGKNISNNIRTDRIIITNNTNAGEGICAPFSDTVFVNVLNSPEAILVADTTVCDGATTNLLVATSGIQNIYESKYSNSLVNYPNLPPVNVTGPLVDTVVYGTYTINGCGAAFDTVFVTIQPVGDFTLALADTTICEINTLALNSGITDATLTHSWTVLGGIGTFSDDAIANPVYSPMMGLTTPTRVDTIIYKVEKADNICFTSSDTMLVTIIQGATFNPLPDTAICIGETVAIDLALLGAADLTWSSNNGTFSSTNTSATIYTPSTLTGTSRVDTLHADLAFPDGGCVDTRETMLVAIYDALPISVGADTSICGGFDFQLNGTLGFGLNDATWSVVGGLGTFNDASLLNAIYTPNPVTGSEVRIDTLVLNASSGLSCLNGADTILLTIKLTPTVSLGADRTVFNTTNVPLMATLDEKVAVSRWISNNGSFQNSGLDVTSYVPNDLGALESRVDRVIYEAIFANATCTSVKDTILITVMTPPSISRGGNSAFCESICLDTAFVNIDNNTGTAVVLANNIDPFDTCQIRNDLDLRFWYSDLGTAEPTTVMDFPALPSNVTFDCTERGEQKINVYVAEDSMNIQLCPIVIQVEDAGFRCGERLVSGRITTSMGVPVEGFEVFVEEIAQVGGVTPDPVKTDADGRYSFLLDVNREYRIVPRNDENLSMGVTAFDNVVISRHILGLQAFDSPYQTIAADVNKSGTVTAFDIVLIRKVVLARDDKFTNNTSWRFIDANYVFDNIGGAAAAPFMESYVVNQNTGIVSNMDFIAVKVGDPNRTADPSALFTLAEDRNTNNNRLLETDNLAIEKGQVYEVPFRFIDGNELQSYQFTMDFAGLELLAIQGGIATPEHFGQTMTKRGLLTAAWSSAEPIEGNRNWFTLKFKANKSGVLSEMLSLNSIVTPIEAVTTDEENVGIQLTFVQSNRTALELFQNKPNPFKTATSIGFALPESGTADIIILDMQGRVLKTIKGDYSEGYNEVQVNFSDLPRGVFYYRLETAHGTKVQKMMRVE